MKKRIATLVLASSVLPVAALGQTTDLEPKLAPAEIKVSDGAGVDLRSGQKIYSGASIAIGDSSRPALSVAAATVSSGARSGTPFGNVSSSCVLRPHENGYCSSHTLNIQLGTASFSIDGSSSNQSLSDGSIYAPAGFASSGRAVRRPDGTMWIFETGSGFETSPTNPLNARLKQIIYPDGEILDYSYGSEVVNGLTRFTRTVRSSLGYELKNVGGSESSTTLVNLACGDACAGFIWPSVKESVALGTTASQYHKSVYSKTWVNGSLPIIIDEIFNASSGRSTVSVTTPQGRMSSFIRPPSNGYVTGAPGYQVNCAGPGHTFSYTDAGGTWSYNYTFAYTKTCQSVRTTSTDPLGNVTTVEGDPGTINITNPLGHVTRYAVNVSRPAGSALSSDGFVVKSVVWPEGNNTAYGYTRGVLSSIDDYSKDGKWARGATNTLYDTCNEENYRYCNRPRQSTDWRGKTATFEYHADSGLVSRAIYPADEAGTVGEVRRTYKKLSARFYDSGKVVSGAGVWRLDVESRCSSMAVGQCKGTRDEVRTRYEYNDNLLPVLIEVSLGDGTVLQTTKQTYDWVGNITSVDGPLDGAGDTTYYLYDANRRKVGEMVRDPSTGKYSATQTTYDLDGLPVRIDVGTAAEVTKAALDAMAIRATTRREYGSSSKLIKETVESGGVILSLTQYNYDAADRLLCIAVRMNPDPAVYATIGSTSACKPGPEGTGVNAFGPDRITENKYDAAGQLIQVRRAVGTADEQAYATYEYTPNGRRKTVIDAGGNRATLTYDGLDRQSGWYFPATTAPTVFSPTDQTSALAAAGASSTTDYEAYEYDANGNRTLLRKRDGRTIAYGYDALNRVVSKTYPNGGARPVYYSYDLRGLQTGARYDSAQGRDAVTSVWDGLGRQVSGTTSMGGVSRTLNFQSNANGSRTQITFPDAQSVSYMYDASGRLTTIAGPLERFGSDWRQRPIASFQYNDAGHVSRFEGGGASSYSYDGTGRLTTLGHVPADPAYTLTISGPCASNAAICYNPAGQITALSKSGNAYAWTGAYNVTRAYKANGRNQYTEAGKSRFKYDDNGNLIEDGQSRYVYDIENRLVSRSDPAVGTVSLGYDPLGRLYEVAGTGSTTRFLYDGDALVGEYDASGSMLRRYVHGPDATADDPIAWYEGAGFSAGDERVLRSDWQGSVVLVTDNSGRFVAANSYDAFGIPDAGNQGRFQYTGQAWIPELGLYYYKARIYSPSLGRFLQTDPIGYDDQINLYAYVANDPINGRDPTGMEECRSNGDGTQTCTSNGSILDSAALALRAGYELLAYYTGLPSLTPNASPATPPKQEDSGDRAGRGGNGRPLSRGDNGGPQEPRPQVVAPTQHAQERRDQASAGDNHRQVGDPNRVVREGRAFTDNQTGNTVYVNGGRAVVVNSQEQQVTQFRVTSQNVQDRIRNERWTPK